MAMSLRPNWRQSRIQWYGSHNRGVDHLFLATETATNKEVVVNRVVLSANEEELRHDVEALARCDSKFVISYSTVVVSHEELCVSPP